MYRTDHADFTAILEGCAKVFGPKELTNDLKTTYWDALKDIPLQQIRELANAHMKRGKFFPKPTELRPKEEKPDASRTAAMDAAFQEGEKRSVENLEDLRRSRPEFWRNDVWLRRCDRIIATESPSSPIYAEALKEAERLRPLVRGY